MPSLSTRSKWLVPVLVAFTFLTQGSAWAIGQQCIGCGSSAPVTAPARPHIAASSLLVRQAPPARSVTVTVAPAPIQQAPAPRVARSDSGFGVWDCIAEKESGGNWGDRSGGFEGGLQFLNSTWLSAGGGRYAQHAYDATPAQQVEVARSWLAQTSWDQWPNTSRACGVR